LNFFDAQDRARRASKWLVVVYVIATALIVVGVTLIVGVAFGVFSSTTAGYNGSPKNLLIATAIVTTLFIFGASLFKTSVLSAGGGRVATDLGGTLVAADVSDPLRRRLRNVVEEMAIASGVPVPEIYVLEEESGINAFAAGYTPGDAAIAVTRGTLELLSRDELQGVVAHEFSHILHGDMRLNIRMMGVLFGIMVISLIGRMITRGGYHASILSRRRDRSAPVILIIGLGLAVLGGIGVVAARVIKAAVSRQREYLADASAVQFTRQSDGIANALKKIGGYSPSSYLTANDPEEVSHMLFGTGSKLFGWFATHPPLTERIQALDPSFKESDYPRVDFLKTRDTVDDTRGEARASGFSTALASGGTVVLPATIAESVGQPAPQHVLYAQELRLSIPATLYDAAHSSELAFLLVLSLILDRSGDALDRQFALLEERMGERRTTVIRNYYKEIRSTGEEFRLPLLEISFPALKLRPAPQLSYLVDLASRLIDIDGKVDLYEFCFYRILMVSLGQAVDPSGDRARKASRKALRQAAVNLLAIVADYGHDDQMVAQAAFDAGAKKLGKWAEGIKITGQQDIAIQVLDHSLDQLLSLSGKGRRNLLRAVSEVADYDQHLSTHEAELIRAICATLDCPLPPILVHENLSVAGGS
jgi:Zn-dependent protease with chaperone function